MTFLRYFLFFLLITCGCNQPVAYIAAGYETLFTHIDKMRIKNSWKLEAYGGSFYDDDIKELGVRFFVYPVEEINYETATHLIVFGIEELLKEINNDTKLKGFLNHYPFSVKAISYSLVFKNKWNEELAFIYLAKGNLFFEILDCAQHNGTLLKKEPYSEVLAQVQAEKADDDIVTVREEN